MGTTTRGVAFWQAALASEITSGPCGKPGGGSERISPDARHSGECGRGVYPVEGSKKRRVESESEELETEETIDPEAYQQFKERMASNGVTKESGAWPLLFEEEVVE